MITDKDPRWQNLKVGTERNGIIFNEKPWDLEDRQFIGQPFRNLLPVILRESRFHEAWFQGDSPIYKVRGGIIQANFTLFTPKPHEDIGQVSKTNEMGTNIQMGIDISPSGGILGYNPLEDPALENAGIAVGFGSRVMLNNLDIPGGFGGWGHFPMLDIIKPPTEQNIQYITQAIIERTGLKKFFILRSSEHGMMMIGPELIDEAHLLDFWNKAELINHYEVDPFDVWVDTRWIAHSKTNYQDSLGINSQQVCGILRATPALPLKPETPVIIASSY